ncbi:MAG: SpoIID/LytB domain-containing protein [bacterium]
MIFSFLLIMSIYLPGQAAAGSPYAAPYQDYLAGSLTKAARGYLDAASASPGEPLPLLSAAVILEELGRTAEALKYMEKAVLLRPGDADMRAELGWMKFQTGDMEGAVDDFSRALAIQPAHIRAMPGLGLAYARLKRHGEAVSLLTAYLKMRPGFAGADYMLAEAYAGSGMLKESSERLRQALKKDFAFTEARLPLAGIYVKEKKYNEAWAQCMKVLDVFKSHPLSLRMKSELISKLTKKPAELRPARRIETPFRPAVVPGIKKSLAVRVGLGTYGKGIQPVTRELKFRVGSPFAVVGSRTGRIYAQGKADERWSAVNRKGLLEVKSPDGKVYGSFKYEIYIKPLEGNSGSVILEKLQHAKGYSWAEIADREYRGYIALAPGRGNGIRIVNVVGMEEYLMSVVPSEVVATWPDETLKAQAVIARTQVLIRRGKGGPHRKDGYQLCDSQHCQVYKGIQPETQSTRNSVINTQGEVLTYRGKPAHTFFYSNCGGHFQSSAEVEGWGAIIYLKGKPDAPEDGAYTPDSPWAFRLWITSTPPAYCNYGGVVASSEYRWLRIIKHRDLEYKANKEYRTGVLKAVIPLRRSVSGHVNSLLLHGSRRKVIIRREHLIRGIMGLGSARSTLVSIEVNRDEKGKPKTYWIHGGGWGHGVGLCQSGAAGMAGKEGKNYEQILEFYYPGTSIRKLKYRKK